MTQPLNLHQRMDKVRLKVDYIQKQKAVEGYKAVTHDQVTGMLREHLIANGIITVVRFTGGTTVDTGGKTSKGTAIVRFEAVYEIDFVNIDDPKDRETYIIPAHANDHGDKAPGKTTSYAVKGAFLKAFNIETGESDESRYGSDDVDVGELKQSMSDAKTIDELRTRTVAALDALGKDHEDYKDVVAYGKALAAKLTAVKQPTEKAPSADAPADPPAAERPAAKGPPASKGLIQSIRNMGATKGLNDEDLLEALRGQGVDVERLEDLDKIQAATILASVTKMGAK